MGALIVALSLLCGASLLLGSLFLLATGAAPERTGDRALLSLWLGICILAPAALATALSAPVGPWFLPAVLGVACCSLIHPKQRTSIIPLVTPRAALCFAAALIPVAAAGVLPVIWADSPEYHAGLIRWYSECGLVRGLSLVELRYGLSSSWFALDAALSHGPLVGRAFSATGCLLLLLGLLHLGLSGARALTGRAKNADIFVLAALLPLLAIFVEHKGSRSIFISPSPDLPCLLLPIVAACSALVLPRRSGGPAVLLIGGAAATMKLSALPLLALAGLFHLTSGRTLKNGIAWLLLPLACVLLFATANWQASGVPLFPSTIGMYETKWSPSRAVIDDFRQGVTRFAQTKRAGQSGEDSALDIVAGWGSANREYALLLLAALPAGIWSVFSAYRRRDAAMGFPAALGLLGTAYVLALAPAARFGVGYAACCLGGATAMLPTRPRRAFFQNHCPGGVQAVLTLALALSMCGFIWAKRLTSSHHRLVVSAVEEGRMEPWLTAGLLLLPSPLLDAEEARGADGQTRLEPLAIQTVMHNGLPFLLAPTGPCNARDLLCVQILPPAVPADPDHWPRGGFLNVARP